MSPKFRGIIVAASALLVLSGCQKTTEDRAKPAATTVDAELLTTGGDGSSWAMGGFNYMEQRYSPLDKINKDNVSQLGIAWTADLPDARAQEATPLVVGDKLYLTTAWSKVIAYNVKTGEELWSYDPEVPGEYAAKACCDVVNRGPALWKGKLFFGTIDGRLIALDALTGAKLWSTQTTDKSKPYSITGAPRVVKGMVIIGNGGAEFGVRGFVSAYDVNDGSMKWRFYTVPNPEGKADNAASDEILQKAASKTWSQDGGAWKEYGGGGTVWDSIVYDAELDQLYLGVGNGAPWNHGIRSNGEGDNLFLSSIVALKPETGEYLWHYQETPGESWDFTATQSIILANVEMEGKQRKVIMHAPKNGFFFVIDRTNGKLISANPYIDGITWASGYDLETGRPIENPKARYYKTKEPFLSIPSAIGAHNWHPMAYSPQAGLAYIPAQTVPAGYAPPHYPEEGEMRSIGFNVGTAREGFVLPDEKSQLKAALAATKGQLVAMDPITGKKAWSVEHNAPWNGGVMATAGGLVFQGTATGQMVAYDAKTGEKLWSYEVQSGVLAAPSTFMVDGEQYIAFTTSKGGAYPLSAGRANKDAGPVPNIPRLIVMKIGGKKKLPALPKQPDIAWDPPAVIENKQLVETGREKFMQYCMVCHGEGAVGGGVTPDLRRSASLASSDLWNSILQDGALADKGMVSFKSVMSPAETEAIRAWVIERANLAKKYAEEESGKSGEKAAGKDSKKPKKAAGE